MLLNSSAQKPIQPMRIRLDWVVAAINAMITVNQPRQMLIPTSVFFMVFLKYRLSFPGGKKNKFHIIQESQIFGQKVRWISQHPCRCRNSRIPYFPPGLPYRLWHAQHECGHLRQHRSQNGSLPSEPCTRRGPLQGTATPGTRTFAGPCPRGSSSHGPTRSSSHYEYSAQRRRGTIRRGPDDGTSKEKVRQGSLARQKTRPAFIVGVIRRISQGLANKNWTLKKISTKNLPIVYCQILAL